jgi:hypothetical protein
VTLTANGKPYVETIVVRPDPMLRDGQGAPSALLAIDAEAMDPRENKPPFWPQAGRGGR